MLPVLHCRFMQHASPNAPILEVAYVLATFAALERKCRTCSQVGPGSYTVPTRHGSKYPSYVPFATSTERGCEADQTSHQVPHCLLLLDTGLSRKPVLAVPWVVLGARSCADIHRCGMHNLRGTVVAV